MSLFRWLSGKSGKNKAETDDAGSGSHRDSHGRNAAGRELPAHDTADRSEDRKLKRHARREQLFVAVREAMTRAGVLSASFKFKVLSLDQRGDQFLVMMDLEQSFAAQVDKLGEIEAAIVQTARARFEILVTSVYWRMDARTAVGRPRPAGAPTGHPTEAGQPPKKFVGQRYEPIQAEEVAAFKQALAAASANSPVAAQNVKVRSGPRSYTLLTGFEDTEMPESAASPALSSTQYGDLN